jgi:hypothetical protein
MNNPDTAEVAPSAPILDLSDTRPFDSFALEILVPGTARKTGWTIVLAGPAHPQTVALNTAFSRELIEKEKAIEFAQVNSRKWKTDEESPEARRLKNVGRVCGRIISWSPNPTFRFVQDAPIAFSVKAATDLFIRPDMAGYFIQITDYLNGEAAFMPPSASS